MRKRTGKDDNLTRRESSEGKETERNGKDEYRTWWERSEEKEKERTGKNEYRTWLKRSEGKETKRNRNDKYPPSRETFDEKQTEKTAKRKKICQGSSWPTVTIKKRTSDSSPKEYATSLLEEKFRTRLVVTDRLNSGRNLADDHLIAESSSTVHSLGEATHLTEKAIPLCLPDNVRWNPQAGAIKFKDERHSLYVVEAAIEELRKIKEPVCVVSIAGPCRDGKSYILSKAFNQPDVFPVGHKMDPETMGIWIWILQHKMKASKLCFTQLVVIKDANLSIQQVFSLISCHAVWSHLRRRSLQKTFFFVSANRNLAKFSHSQKFQPLKYRFSL